MNANIPEAHAKIRPKSPLRSIVAIAGLCLVFVSLFFVSNGTSRTAKTPATARMPAVAPRILMIGDSLSVGAFGAVMRNNLVRAYGSNNVFVYASCGSAPEHWLRDEPEFVTKCGYRQQTPQVDSVLDFRNGRPPKRVPTPKLNTLVINRPSVVLVQLGTNWMDRIAAPKIDKQPDYNSILDRFIAALRGGPGTVRRIIWITPPDSAHFTRNTQRKVELLLKNAAARDHFELIISSGITHYLMGKTGGDGIHYNEEAGTEWANRVMRKLPKF